MRVYISLLFVVLLLSTCKNGVSVIDKKEYKLILHKAISNPEFLPLLESSNVSEYDVIMKDSKLSDSLKVGKNVFFINRGKLKFNIAQIITIKIDSINQKKKEMEIVFGSVPPRRSKIYGKFILEYKNEKWVVNYITSGIWDYR